METKDLLVPLLAALWGCTNLVLAATNELNRMRNVVLTGKDQGLELSLELRRHIMQNDWRPTAQCVTLMCFGFSAISGLSPLLLKSECCTLLPLTITLCVAGYAAAMGGFWIPAGRADWSLMQKTVGGARSGDDIQEQLATRP